MAAMNSLCVLCVVFGCQVPHELAVGARRRPGRLLPLPSPLRLLRHQASQASSFRLQSQNFSLPAAGLLCKELDCIIMTNVPLPPSLSKHLVVVSTTFQFAPPDHSLTAFISTTEGPVQSNMQSLEWIRVGNKTFIIITTCRARESNCFTLCRKR